MNRNAEAILEAALALPEEDREDFAEALWGSLPPLPEVEAAWRLEVASRVAAFEAGERKTIPWLEVREKLLAKLND